MLVILAAVSISAVYRAKVIDYATESSQDYAQKSLIENKIMEGTTSLLDSTVDRIGDILGGKTETGDGENGGEETEVPENAVGQSAGTVVQKPKDWDSSQVQAISDGGGANAVAIPLPEGFYYIGGDIDTGIVVSDKQDDTLESSGVTSGNQFVWIPVREEEDFERTNFDENTGKPTSEGFYGFTDAKDCTEPYANGYEGETKEYETMRGQVFKYGGFYIGRFEAGINSTTMRTDATEAQEVVCKRGVAPYNHIPWGKDMNDPSEIPGKSGAVYLAKNFAKQQEYTSIASCLVYGCQWDAMCRYVEPKISKEYPRDSIIDW